MHSERSKIINLKINNYRDNKSTTTKNIRHILSSINPDVHVNKQKHFIQGSWGHESPAPSEAKIFKKKNKQNEGFSFKMIFFTFIFFHFWAVLTKSMSLLPRSPKIITSALQLPEKK